MRARAVTLLAGIGLLLLPASAAVAGGQASFASPGADQQLSGSVPITVDVDGDNRNALGNGPDHEVTARLASSAGGGPAAGTSVVSLACIAGGCNQDSTWGGVSMSPASFAPFGRPSRVCNGAWFIEVQVDGGGYAASRRVLVSQLPGAPSGLVVDGGREQATLSWDLGGEADLAGYRIQRRPSGGSVWDAIGEVDAPTTSFTDAVAAGTWEYRVLALRPDGRDPSGAPATICTDGGRELSAASASRTVEVDEVPAPTPTPSSGSSGGSTSGGSGSGGSTSGGSGSGGSTSGGSTSGGSTSGGSGSGGSTSGGTTSGGDTTTGGSTSGGTDDGDTDDGDTSVATDGDAADGNDDGDTTDGEPSTTSSETADDDTTAGVTVGAGGNAGPRVRPPSRGSSSSLFLDTGTVDLGDDGTSPLVAAPDPDRDRERFFGEDDEFSEEIDFGDVEAIGGLETRTREVTTLQERQVAVPTALQGVFGEQLALGNILNSIAGGLLLLALSLHLRRWTREGLAEI